MLHVLACLPPPQVVVAKERRTMVVDRNGGLVVFGTRWPGELGLGEDTWETRDQYSLDGDFDADEWDAEPDTRLVSTLPQLVDWADEKLVSFAGGQTSSLDNGEFACVTGEGHLRQWGYHSGGWPPRGSCSFPRLQVVPPTVRVAHIASADGHISMLTSLGELFTWGTGGVGQLGHGVQDDEGSPRRVEALAGQRVVDTDCGEETTVAVTEAGELFVFGFIVYRETPSVDYDRRMALLPESVAFPGKAKIRRASCGCTHFAAAGVDGTMYTWGQGSDGQLGHPGSGPDLVTGYNSAPLYTSDSTRYFEDTPRAVVALAGQHVELVCCAEVGRTLAATVEGQLWAWGKGDKGELGQGQMDSGFCRIRPGRCMMADEMAGLESADQSVRFTALSCGNDHTVVARANGEVWTFGSGEYGQLGHPVSDSNGFEDLEEGEPDWSIVNYGRCLSFPHLLAGVRCRVPLPVVSTV